MPFSYAQYAGNGSTTGPFSVPFPYLLKAHVKLYTGYNILDGTFTTQLAEGAGYTWISGTQVQLTTPHASGTTLTIKRETPSTSQVVVWNDGSNLISDDQNTADLQNLYVVQEQQDRNDAGITQSTAAAAAATAATTASASAVSTANAASAAAAGAVSTANAANAASANALGVANTKGDQAINTANAASAAAAGAVSTANAANTAATNAVASAAAANATAASAVTTAGNADVKADAAIAAVASSVNYTAVANVAAIPASPANNTYIEVQNTTGLESFSPLAGRPAGFVGDAGLKARLRYTSSGSTWNWIDYAPSDSDARYLKKTGGTMTGKITLDGAPIAPLHPATKGYVDGNVSALQGDIGTVSTAAAAAQSTANTAVSNAATAQSTANTAVSNAAAAQTTANGALPKAGGTMSGSITFAGGQAFPTSGISAATTSSSGIVQLSDSTSAASSSTAATSAAVKAVQDFAQVVSATANAAMPKAGGVFSGPVTIPFAQAGTGAVTRTVDSKLKDWVSVKDFGAVGDGIADDTAAIQAAINSVSSTGGRVYIPRGLYLVDPAIGINVVSGLELCGNGRANTQLVAKPVGGTILKRAFSNTGPNAYVDGVTIRDIGIILRHPATADPSNYYQVAIQLRHITRSLVEDVYIGNYPGGISSGLTSPASQADARQGYGVSIGSTSNGDPAYAGGEVNTCRRVMCAGVRYGFTIDNPTFATPYGGSAAYMTVIDCCEVSAAEVGISQYGQYGAGCTFSNNVIQAIDQMRGSSATAYSIYIDGYEHFLYGGYNESPFTDYELYLSSSSRRNRIHTWLSDDKTFFDGGAGNVIERINGTSNKWSISVNNRNLQNGIAKAWVSFYWNGTAIVINSAYNVNGVLRVGAGDYRIDFGASVFDDANYTAALAGRPDVSGNPGTIYNYTNKATANYRILTHITGTGYTDFLEVTATFWGNP